MLRIFLFPWNETGKWVTTQEEALAASHSSSDSIKKKSILKKPLSSSESKTDAKSQKGPPASLNPTRTVKGAPSSLTINKRKRQDKPKAISAEEAAALKTREAARKRVEEREKSLLGLYRH